jgi:hypothetical protein
MDRNHVFFKQSSGELSGIMYRLVTTPDFYKTPEDLKVAIKQWIKKWKTITFDEANSDTNANIYILGKLNI